MPGSPEARDLRAFVAQAQWRVSLRAMCSSAALAIGLTTGVVAAVPSLRAQPLAAVVVSIAAAGGAAVGAMRARWARRAWIHDIDGRASMRNLLVTAAELTDGRISAPAYVTARVVDDATRRAAAVDLARVLPVRRPAVVLASAVVVAATTMLWLARPRADVPGGDVTRPFSGDPAIAAVAIVITPPAYAGQTSRTVANPSRIDALAGSRIAFTVDADAAWISMVTPEGTRGVRAGTGGAFTGELTLAEDGFVAFVPHAADGRPGPRHLIGLVTVADALPRVRLVQPDRDLVVPDGNRRIDIGVEADDDLGLGSLDVRYTKVTGSGENFTFAEGDVPVTVERPASVAWRGRGTLDLAALKLEPGDMVIYRGRATDRRPGAPIAESETLIIEIAAPGAVAGDGFAIDDREDRYAVSQQMVIVKTERLLRDRGSMTSETITETARMLAAEQRQVRAEFVFMMGGELADAGIDISTLHEHEEAEREADLAAGYLINQGRADLIRAIRAMSRAAVLLNEATELDRALAEEKSALTSLQRAFTRARYLLRTLTTRERLDLTRRLTGDLAALAPLRLPATPAPAPPRAAAIRLLLSDLATVRADADAVTVAGALVDGAERLLKLDPSSAPLRDAATRIAADAAELRGNRQPTRARDALDRAVLQLTALLRDVIPAAPARTPTLGERQLRGALADAARAGGSK
jgi:hypothetical protein